MQYEVHVNVWEWVEDEYDEEFYSRPRATGPDPLSTSGSGGLVDRVSRGGGWGFLAGGCRSAFRGINSRWDRFNYLGFRPAAPCP